MNVLGRHALPILFRRKSTRHVKEEVRASLSRHDHSRHVQASVRMKSGIPSLQNVKMVEVRKGVIVCTTNRDLEWQLRQNEHFRILFFVNYTIDTWSVVYSYPSDSNVIGDDLSLIQDFDMVIQIIKSSGEPYILPFPRIANP